MLFLLALIFCLIATPLAIAGMLTPAFLYLLHLLFYPTSSLEGEWTTNEGQRCSV
jgi:hypothetical protein